MHWQIWIVIYAIKWSYQLAKFCEEITKNTKSDQLVFV